jgi:hypothetical protein
MLQVIVLVLALFPSLACAQARIALRIGNRACDASVGVLKNAHNDIAVVGEALARQGFEVLPPLNDAKRSAILGTVNGLSPSAQRGKSDRSASAPNISEALPHAARAKECDDQHQGDRTDDRHDNSIGDGTAEVHRHVHRTQEPIADERAD